MNIFEIIIQRRVGTGWPVVVEQKTAADSIPVRKEGTLTLDEVELHMQTSALDYGRVLGAALFRNGVRDAFAKAVSASDDRLRVLLVVEADDLQALRWERLCAPLDGHWDFLYLNQRTLFSLYLPSITDRRFPAIGRRDLRALVVVASPNGLASYGLQPFDVAAATTGVRAALGDIPTDLLAEVEDAVGPASLDALAARLTAEPYTILHIVCHGQFSCRTGETSLFLSNAQNQVDRVDGTRLLRRLRQLRGAHGLPHLAFLAACESGSPAGQQALGGLGQRLVRELGMPAVIAMTDKVSVDTAQGLTAGFYQHLPRHGEVDRALVESMAPLAGRPDIITPALYSRLGGRPLFSDRTDRALTDHEASHGLERMHALMQTRAPILLPQMEEHAAALRATVGVEPGLLPPEFQRERRTALAELALLSREVLDMDFAALCLDQEPAPYDGRCPFRGLNAFTRADHEFFFGREALVEHLHHKLNERHFLALLGASGSGKSSLVLAGLLPRLQQEQPTLHLCHFSPGPDPLSQLENYWTDLRSGEPGRILLFIDHFEELFTLCTDPAQRELFVAKLLSLVEAGSTLEELRASTPSIAVAHPAARTDDRFDSSQLQVLRTHNGRSWRNLALSQPHAPKIRIVLAMRADFWGECARYPALKRLMLAHQELIDAMDTAALRRTMELQAHKVGLRFEADLSNTILDEVRDEPGAMPLLQHLLLELWKRRHGRWLRAQEYRRLGGVRKAIAYTADRFYESLSPDERLHMREIIVRLTRLDDESSGSLHRDTRRRVRTADLIPDGSQREAVKALLARLADAKLVVTSINPTTQLEEAEVAHEALIRHWPRLQGWIQENRARYRLRQGIARAAQTWHDNGRHVDLLIHRGGQLDDALPLAEEPGFLVARERAYIDACVELRDRERRRAIESAQRLARAAEARRRAEEQARHMAEERAEERTRAARNLRRWALLAACVGFLAIAAAGMTGLFWKTARAERDQALRDESRLLTTFALQHLTSDPVSSLHLALAALPGPDNRRPHLPQAEFAATQALHASLERTHLSVAERLASPAQVALGGDKMAVAGDGLLLVDGDLSNPVQLAEAGQPFTSVAWRDTETLLSTTKRSVQIWRDGELSAAQRFEQDIRCAAWRPGAASTPQGGPQSQLAICSGNALWLWVLGETPQRLHHFDTAVAKTMWSPDGQWLLARDVDGSALVWDAQTQHAVRLTDPPAGERLWTVAWSPDGVHLVAVLESGVMQVWRADRDRLAPVAAAHLLIRPGIEAKRLTLGGIQFVDQQRFIVWESRRGLSLWSATGNELHAFAIPSGSLRGLSLSPDGTTLLTYADSGVAHLWRVETGEPLVTLQGHRASILAVAWRDGYVATGGADGTGRIWRVDTGEELITLYGHKEGAVTGRADVLGLHWLDEQHLISYGEDGSLRRWLVFDEEGQPLCTGLDAYGTPRCYRHSRALRGHMGDIWTARWLDAQTILTTGADGTARRWSLSSGRGQMLPNESDDWREVVWSPDGKRAFTYAPEPAADAAIMNGIVWDVATGEPVARVEAPIADVFWLDACLFIGLTSGDLLRVDPATGEVWTRYLGHAAAVTQVDVFENMLATAGSDGVTRLWELESGELQAALDPEQEMPIFDVQWSADGRHLLTAGLSVVLWDVESEQPLWRYELSELNGSAAFSPDEESVAVSAGTRVVLLETLRGEPVWRTPDHEELVVGLQWSRGAAWESDGQTRRARPLLITWSGDGSARVWDVQGRAELMRLSEEGPLNMAAISPDGSHILTASYTGVLRVWESWLRDPAALRDTVQAQITRPLNSPVDHAQLGPVVAAR